MKIVNFLGGPAARKSTLAGATYVALKELGRSVHLVQEYATYMILAGREAQLISDQLSALAKQHHLLDILRGKVEFAVTDSPLVLNALYGRNVPAGFEELVLDYFGRFDNVNFVLEVDWNSYTEINRVHSREDAQQKHEELIQLLDRRGIPYTHLSLGSNRIQTVIEALGVPLRAEDLRLSTELSQLRNDRRGVSSLVQLESEITA